MQLSSSLSLLMVSLSLAAGQVTDDTESTDYTVTIEGRGKDPVYKFLDSIAVVVVPRAQDFRGYHTTCKDGHSNLRVRVTEQIIFPETDHEATKLEQLGGRVFIGKTEVKAAEAKALLA
jgi:ribosomal protein L5